MQVEACHEPASSVGGWQREDMLSLLFSDLQERIKRGNESVLPLTRIYTYPLARVEPCSVHMRMHTDTLIFSSHRHFTLADEYSS